MRLVLMAMLSGCTTQAGFEEDFVAASCDRVEECTSDGGESLFGGRQGCEDFYNDALAEWTIGCTFDPKAARACLDQFETVECGDSISAECDPVFTGGCIWGGQQQ